MVLSDLDQNFQGLTFQVAHFTSRGREKACITIVIRYEVMHLSSNSAIANHHDLDLYFQNHEILNASISKTVRASEKRSVMTFIEDDVRCRMAPLSKLYSVTVTFILRVKYFLSIYLL